MIAVIDYGLGNLGSVSNMLKKLGFESIVTSDENIIQKANKIILPGVGSFDKGVSNLKSRGLFDVLNHKVNLEKIPILGICLGLQLMTEVSEEGTQNGFGWIKGKTVKFQFSENENKLKIPHMGWNLVKIVRDNALIKNENNIQKYYFANSYHIICDNNEDVILKTHHGYEFVSGVQMENIYGVQFHPEKSHNYGLNILNNFCLLK